MILGWLFIVLGFLAWVVMVYGELRWLNADDHEASFMALMAGGYVLGVASLTAGCYMTVG